MSAALKSGDHVTARSLEEPGTPPRTLHGTLEILRLPAQDFYPPFTAYFVDGQEANVATIKSTQQPNQSKQALSSNSEPQPIAAGLAVVAEDTGRVLMLQRSLSENDPAAGKWEFPGGTREPNETPDEAAIREWSEETGALLPTGSFQGSWTSPNGVYQGFVYTIAKESDLEINLDHEDRGILNPDDPDGDQIEVVAWWTLDDLQNNPALRDEAKHTDWNVLRRHHSVGTSNTFNNDCHDPDTGEFCETQGANANVDPSTVKWWHGTPSGDLRGGEYGLHIGTKQAALEALNARIGTPVEGEWDGTRVYGETLLKGKKSFTNTGKDYASGYSAMDAPDEDHYPTGSAFYGGFNGPKIPLTVKPNIIGVRIKGEMSNSTQAPMSDSRANGQMKGQLKKGNAKRGYFYKNEGEDTGSVSAVVPNGNHLEVVYDKSRGRGLQASASTLELFNSMFEFYNKNHDALGRFTEASTGAKAKPERDIPVKPFWDEDKEFDRVSQLEAHYGRKELAPEMGGLQWAFEGGSPPITEAAQDVLQGYPYDHYDRYLSYDHASYQAAETILKTLEKERSDVTLYSGHRRSREEAEGIVKDGELNFPLVATSPDNRLAEVYAGHGNKDTVSIVYEFPPGSQAGFYQANEHIATGGYSIQSAHWTSDNTGVNIKLRQVHRNTVPEKIDLEEANA